MKRRRSFSPQWLMLPLLVLASFLGSVRAATSPSNTTNNATSTSSASASSSSVFKYISTNAPDCEASVSQTVVTLYGRNRNVYTQCVAESLEYSLFPYSGYLPSDQQLTAMVSSVSCLYFFEAILALPALRECNLGGLDVKSAIETLLMTSEDIVNGVEPLTAAQFIEFITWRHTRNIAKEINEPYDAASESAVAFEKQLADAAFRLNASLTDTLRIQVNGTVIGTSSNGSEPEVRSAEDTPATVKPSSGETSVKSPGAASTSSAVTSVVSGAVAVGCALVVCFASW